VDPEYIYLLNGVVAIEKPLQIDFYDCPGTPMILYTGIEAIFNLFRNSPLMEDIVRNPEIYLNVINIILTDRFSICLF